MKHNKSQQIRNLLTKRADLSVKDIIKRTKASAAMVYAIRAELIKANAVSNLGKVYTPRAALKATPKTITHDKVNSPKHYTAGGIETIDFIKAKLTKEQYEGYLLGNIIKYSSRMGLKGEAKIDAGKLHWYTKELESNMPCDSK